MTRPTTDSEQQVDERAEQRTHGRTQDRAPHEPLGRPFAHLFGATGLSNLADGVLTVGVPLLALTLTTSALEISLLTTAFTLPWLVLALPVGVLVDRHDRARLLLWASLTRVAVLAGATAAALAGALTMPVLLALLLALGTAEVVADSTATVLVPGVVPRSRLAAANSRVLGVQQLANAFLGGPLAGAVLALGTGWFFGVPAALCAAGAALVLRGVVGRVPGTGSDPTGSRPTAHPDSMRTELVAGLRYLRGHRVVGPLVLGSTVLNFASSAYFAVFVLWVVGPGSAVRLDARWYGLLTAALAVGALLGALAAEHVARRTSEAPLIFTCWALNSLLLLVPLLVPDARAIAATFAVVGFANMLGNVVGQSLRQRLVPSSLLGRVGGAGRMLAYGSMPLGAALGGVVAETFGLPSVLVGAAVLSLVGVAWVAHAVPQRSIDAADAALQAELAA